MKIGLTGTQSVGKSTLVDALEKSLKFKGYKFATERSKYLSDLGIPLNTDSTLKGQTVFLAERYIPMEGVKLEDNGVRCIDENYRNIIDTTIKNIITSYGGETNKIIPIPPRLTVEERVAFIEGNTPTTYL